MHFCIPMYRHRSSSDLLLPDDSQPYYGGLSGQFLQLKNGKLQKFFLSEAQRPRADSSNGFNGYKRKSSESTKFEEDFNKIQAAAARLVTIQELAKQKGTFSDDDNRVYAASLLELGQAAQNLAKLQQTGQIKDFSVLLQPYQAAVTHKTPQHNMIDDSIAVVAAVTNKEDETKVEEEIEQPISETELLPAVPLDPYEDNNDSVAIVPPKKDASVAEAKPVGKLNI